MTSTLLILCVVVLLLLAGALMLWQYSVHRSRQTAAQAVIEQQLGQRIKQLGYSDTAPESGVRQMNQRAWQGPPGLGSLLLCAGVVLTPGFWLRYVVVVG